jgi:outer membrane receptor for ferrienterochelin and colicins
MKKVFLIVVLLLPVIHFSQTIKGKVIDSKKEALIGANVYWSNSSIAASTNEQGSFEIAIPDSGSKKLIATYIGYQSDTIVITTQTFVSFKLKDSKTLAEIVVVGEKDGITLSSKSTEKLEIIGQGELKKSACCDLAGCFETQSSIQPHTTNVITNSKELRILGLSGVYNQVLIDGFPMIQGLAYTYGISGIPGTLVDNIYVAKGANSVMQGYESISGQVNVITKDPDKSEKLLVNMYMNSFMEKHLNANVAFKKKKWSNLTAVHMVQPANKTDRDHDDFLDLPLLTRYVVYNKIKYGKEKDWGISFKMGMRYLNEQRIGGQKFFDPTKDKGTTNAYGQTVNMSQPEVYGRIGYRFNDAHNIAIYSSAFTQEQNSYFGTTKYKGVQNNAYVNAQYELNYNEKHFLKTGLSFRHLHLTENIAFTDTSLKRTYAGNYNRVEDIPGVFAENSMSLFKDKLNWIVGIRADLHNTFGYKVTPRTMIKWDAAKNTIVRASIGKGWRTVNLFSENIGLLASSRDIIITERLEPEEALNYGANLTQKFERMNMSGHFSLDVYRTEFQNQIFPNYDDDPTKAIVKNFKGTSISNGLQAEVYVKLWRRFEFKTGYNYLDVYQVINSKKEMLPFNPTHKILVTLGFKPVNNKFHWDINIHSYGKQRLPNTDKNPTDFKQPDFSKPYQIFNTQFTYNFKKIEVYAGCENILNFRQYQPLVSWQDPFGKYFDSSYAWGPTRGREIYGGIRFKIDTK